MRTLHALLAILIAPLLLAATPPEDVSPRGQKASLVGPTVAVISGLRDETSFAAANIIADNLADYGDISVIDHDKIPHLLDNYPFNIRGPYTAAYFSITEDWSNTDRERIRQIQKKLGVDYLYVIWAPTAAREGYGKSSIHLVAQLFEGRESTPVRNDRIISSARGRTTFGCLSMTMHNPTPQEQYAELRNDCTSTAAEIIGTIRERQRR